MILAGVRTMPAPNSAVPPMNGTPIFAIPRTTIGFSSTTQPIVVKPSGAGLRTMIRRVSAGLFTMVSFPATILFTVARSSSISRSITMRLYSIALLIGARLGSTARCTEAQFL